MTDFERIKGDYQYFNEDGRLSGDSSGRLEYEMAMAKLRKYLPESGCILDLGGATGAYAFPLAVAGYQVWLADLSERLIGLAREPAEMFATGCFNNNATWGFQEGYYPTSDEVVGLFEHTGDSCRFCIV